MRREPRRLALFEAEVPVAAAPAEAADLQRLPGVGKEGVLDDGPGAVAEAQAAEAVEDGLQAAAGAGVEVEVVPRPLFTEVKERWAEERPVALLEMPVGLRSASQLGGNDRVDRVAHRGAGG